MKGKFIAKTRIIDSTDPPFIWIRDPDGDDVIEFPADLPNVGLLVRRLLRSGAIEYVKPPKPRAPRKKKEIEDGKD